MHAIMTPPRNPETRNPKTLGGRALTCSRGRNAIMSRPRNPKTLGGRTLRCSRGRNAIMTPPRNPETRNPKALGGRTFRCSRGGNAIMTPPRNPETRKCFLVVSDRILWSQVTPCTVEVLLALSVNMRFCGRKRPHFVVISDPESFTGVCGRK